MPFADSQAKVRARMRAGVERAGYYPELALQSLSTTLADDQVVDFLVHHEATFDREELRRHATVLVLTPGRLVVQHTDEHPADDVYSAPYASSVTEAVRLDAITTVVVTRVVTKPAEYQPDSSPSELMLTVGWGAVRRMELEPVACGDPSCEADHGLGGSSTVDDLALRFAEAADGSDAVERAISFAGALSSAAGSVG